jgi:hypothetical protein
MNLHKSMRQTAIAAAIAAMALGSMGPPVLAAPADIALVDSYEGSWRGRGTTRFAGADASETVLCKLNITDAGPGKVNFKGTCALAAGKLAMTGTMAYNGAANQYEAIMTSNTTYSGIAIGKRRGQTVDFRLNTTDETNTAFAIKAGMALVPDGLDLSFTVTNRSTGAQTIASVPFRRR